MKARTKAKLYNMSFFQEEHGLNRIWVSGFIAGAKLPAVRGKKNSLNVDDNGRRLILSEARALGLISA